MEEQRSGSVEEWKSERVEKKSESSRRMEW